MGITLLAGLGIKLGSELVGSIMEKTLSNAKESMAKNRTAFDRFDSVVGQFGGRAPKLTPAKQFALALPLSLAAQYGAGRFCMGLLTQNLGNFQSLLGLAKGLVDQIAGFQPQTLQQNQSTGKAINPGAFGSGLNVDTHAMAASTGYGSQSASGSGGMGPMEMFQKMQEAQQAAQMFELAVKIADIQHQAAMSAIRGIRY
ncbi:MAG: hypothetical protein WBM02_10600 [bacterium]